MKITCQACHSKYNVADEKVQGKIVKIRCRKCGATIVVHGNSPPAGATAPTPSEAPPPPAGRITAPDQGQWHVSLSDTDQRQMTMAELVTAYNEGIANQETFVWTDGMADWKPLAEVEAIVLALNLASKADGPTVVKASEPPKAAQAQIDGAAAPPAKEFPGAYRQPAATAPVAYRQLETESPVAYRQPEAATPVAQRQPEAVAPIAYRAPEVAAPATSNRQPEAVAAVAVAREAGRAADLEASAAEPRRASLVRRESRGRDLFGASAESQSHPLDERPVPQHAAASYASDIGKPTGQRNENSVLFSLAMLTKTGEQRAPQTEPSATTEDSGMIDLKALAEKAASMRPAADGVARASALSTKAEVYVPPLAVSPSFGSYLGASPARPPRNRTLAIVGGGVGVVALVVFGVFLGTQLGASTSAPAIASAAAASDSPDASEAASAAAPTASDTAAETASAAPSATASAPTAKAAGGWHPPPGWRPGGGAAGGVKPAGGGAAAGGAAPAGGSSGGGGATPPPPPPKKTSDCGCNGDLMCLMKCSASGH